MLLYSTFYKINCPIGTLADVAVKYLIFTGATSTPITYTQLANIQNCYQ